MANTKSQKIEETVETTEAPKEVERKELDLDKVVTIRNISDWPRGFMRLNTIGDVHITSYGSYRITRGEIIAQIQNNNRLFVGIDGRGSHATLYIEDKPTRVEVGFESEDGTEKQMILSDDLIKQVFATRGKDAFEKAFKEAFVTRYEQRAVLNSINRLGINDYNRIRFAENYTGMQAR